MPAYDILYLDAAGALAHTFSADCDDDRKVRVLAHAMKLPTAERLEVWHGKVLVYARDVTPLVLAG